jgi:lysyl-tRNA synthetase class 1
MFWADTIVASCKKRFLEKILSKNSLIVRDEKTCSGRVHVGSLRGVAIHSILNEVLRQQGIYSKFLFEINDFDPMDDCPPNLAQTHSQFLGKPLCHVPAPEGSEKNFAEYYGKEFISVIERLDFSAEYYRLSELYQSGRMNDVIQQALSKADHIRDLYKSISGSEKQKDWLPFHVVCPNCGNIGSTKATDFDGETVAFSCGNYVKWAKGCGNSGRISPFDGNGKLGWKVEWAAKWKVVGVDIEGAGKDHCTKGGSREVSRYVSEQIFEYPSPFDIPYEFFNIGGLKMSSSKGRGASAKEISDLLPPKICRLLFLRPLPKRPIDFDPKGDTIPNLYDEYDRLSQAFFSREEKYNDFSRIFEMIHTKNEREKLKNIFIPRFREIAFLVQLPHIDLFEKVKEMKGNLLNEEEIGEVELRAKYAKKWIDQHAPEKYIFRIHDSLPVDIKEFTEGDKEILSSLLGFFTTHSDPDGETVHGFLHTLKTTLEKKPQEIFSPIYRAFLGRTSGPKAGWFLSVLGSEFIKKRLQEVLLEEKK